MKFWGLASAGAMVLAAGAAYAAPVPDAKGMYTTAAEAIANPTMNVCEAGEQCVPAALAHDGDDGAIHWLGVTTGLAASFCTEPTATYSVECSEPDAIRTPRMYMNVCSTPTGGVKTCGRQYAPLPPRRPG